MRLLKCHLLQTDWLASCYESELARLMNNKSKCPTLVTENLGTSDVQICMLLYLLALYLYQTLDFISSKQSVFVKSCAVIKPSSASSFCLILRLLVYGVLFCISILHHFSAAVLCCISYVMCRQKPKDKPSNCTFFLSQVIPNVLWPVKLKRVEN